MRAVNGKLVLLIIFKLVLLAKCEEAKEEGRDFQGYYPPEEDKKWDYQIIQHPPNYYPANDGYSKWDKGPILPFLGKGLNLLLLKMGVIGLVKAVFGIVFLGFLLKLPLVLLKLAFLKSFFLPFLVAPLLVGMFMNQMNQPSGGGGMAGGMAGGVMPGGGMTGGGPGGTEEKPQEDAGGEGGMMNIMGRELADNLTSMAWEGVKMFAKSDQCMERIFCLIGASNNTSIGLAFSRMLKFLHHSSPPDVQQRMTLMRNAFDKGSQGLSCTDEDYKCQSPELVVQQGLSKVKIF